MDIWKNIIIDKHFWAFYYYCKRLGDKIWFQKLDDNRANLYLIKNGK
ncbi:hypothetical protein LCGC14_1001650 [marine sediment metagenome]|uniref:Uncharacterized protein n=1 Tax=marine sediment metagenome TaxID=412755 RepID=A0A0F9QLA8_9ZZZZ